MSSHARVLFFVCAASVVATAAAAQPHIFAVPSPPANERGWMNTGAQVEFLCARATRCTDTVLVKTSGAGQIVRGTAEGEGGETVSTEVTLNIDGLPPAVSIDGPEGVTATSAASIAVVARAADAISGLMSATCNGLPAPISQNGMIRCDVPLFIGANDVVVEVSDRADNSGSAGFRIVRTASVPRVSVIPENIGMIVGQVTTVQVQDAAGLPVRRVVWESTDPSIGEMSNDGRHRFTAKAPGRAWLTASTGAVSGRMLISVYAGDRLPAGSTRWQIGNVMILQTPDTQPLKAGDTVNAVATNRNGGAPTTIESINRTTGWLNWRERPATQPEEIATAIREMTVGGGAVLVFDTADGRSALLRSGGPQWRYQFPNRIRQELVLSEDGGIFVLETTRAGFTQLVGLDGATGHVGLRQPLPNGTHLVLSVRCVKGAHGASYVPAQVGPLNPQLRSLHFSIVRSDDREDFGVCGEVSGSFKRTIMLATIDTENRVETAATLEGSAARAPDIELFEVEVDRQGGKLLPWATRDTQTGARQFHVTRLSDDGKTEYTLPGVGKIWLSGRDDDLAATTDGIHLVGFNVVTGKVVVSQAFEKGVRILGVQKGRVTFQHAAGTSAADIPIEPPR